MPSTIPYLAGYLTGPQQDGGEEFRT